MSDLRRETKTGVGLESAPRIHIGQHDFHAQNGEEGRVERIERMRRQRLGNADPAPISRRNVHRTAKEELASLLHQVGSRRLARFSFPYILVQAATATKRKTASGYFEK